MIYILYNITIDKIINSLICNDDIIFIYIILDYSELLIVKIFYICVIKTEISLMIL